MAGLTLILDDLTDSKSRGDSLRGGEPAWSHRYGSGDFTANRHFYSGLYSGPCRRFAYFNRPSSFPRPGLGFPSPGQTFRQPAALPDPGSYPDRPTRPS